MADRKITDLTALAAGSQATGDLLTIVDVSEAAATDKNKKITVESLFKGIPSDVGIGITSPGTILNIRSDSSDDGILLEKNDGTDVARLFFDGTSSDARLDMFSGGSANIQLKANGVSHFSGGNVGIGTTSPNYELQVNASDTVSVLQITNTTTGSTNSDGLLVYQNGLNSLISNQEAGSLRFETSATERMRIDSSGNVGIGTAAPSQQLHIASANTSTSGTIIASDSQGRGVLIESPYIGNSVGKIGISGTDSALAFGSGSSNSERMRIDSSGNVGIGTTSPNGLLTVQANSGRLLTFRNSTTGTGSSDGSYIALNGSDLQISNAESAPITFYTGDTERMRIDSSGRVGIGTTATQQVLTIDVNDSGTSQGSFNGINIANTNTTANNGSAITFGQTVPGNSNARIGVIQTARGPSESQEMFFGLLGSGSYSERMRIDSSGNVGVGTSSPTDSNGFGRCIDIRSSTGAAIYLRDSDDTTNDTFAIGRDNTTSYLITNSGNLTFSVAGSERMRIDSSGRLLVGTTTGYGRIHADDYSMNPAGSTWLSAAYVASGAFGGGYALLDGSKGYSMYCADNGNDFFIQGHTSTTAQGSGGVKLNDRATSWTSASDERQKQNLVPITGAIDKVKTLRTVTGNYEWAPDTSHAFLIAQDVQEVLPQAVSVMNKSAATEDQRLGLAYTETIPLLTAALKEAIAEIETLKTKVAALEAG